MKINTASGFQKIERIWAEDGLVKVLEKNGRVTALLPRQAAARAVALNQMKVPQWHRKSQLALVERIIAVIREARHQFEDPTKKTAAIANVVQGLTVEGKPLASIATAEDKRVADLRKLFPFLPPDEIRFTLNDSSLDEQQKLELMEKVNAFKKAQAPGQ